MSEFQYGWGYYNDTFQKVDLLDELDKAIKDKVPQLHNLASRYHKFMINRLRFYIKDWKISYQYSKDVKGTGDAYPKNFVEDISYPFTRNNILWFKDFDDMNGSTNNKLKPNPNYKIHNINRRKSLVISVYPKCKEYIDTNKVSVPTLSNLLSMGAQKQNVDAQFCYGWDGYDEGWLPGKNQNNNFYGCAMNFRVACYVDYTFTKKKLVNE